MSIRGPTGKFFYDRVHDVYLYFLVLENHIYDEAKGDFIYTRSGEIKIRGGWPKVAQSMTNIFGRTFKESQVRARYDLIMSKSDEATNELFNCVMDFRDDLERVRSVMEA